MVANIAYNKSLVDVNTVPCATSNFRFSKQKLTSPIMSVEQNIRTFKDFLQFYNLMSETCFSHCINTFKRNEVEPDEADCVEKCAMKLMRFNNRSIGVYAEIQNQLVEQRTAELEKEALAQQEKLQEISALPVTTTTENSQSTSVTPSS